MAGEPRALTIPPGIKVAKRIGQGQAGQRDYNHNKDILERIF
ncbi:MAG: hypothetical protein U5J63_04845 [Fodinibius sp.]|nr:hypothetical protein [Fodinibius sp.]